MMVGRTVELEVTKTPAKPGAVVLEVRDLVVEDDRGQVIVDHLDLDVYAGEVLGIAGVQGNGQTELVEAINGLRHIESGTIRLQGQLLPADPRAITEGRRRLYSG